MYDVQEWNDKTGWESVSGEHASERGAMRELTEGLVNGGALIGEYRIIDTDDYAASPLYITIERRR